MQFLRTILVLLLISIGVWNCEKDTVSPEDNTEQNNQFDEVVRGLDKPDQPTVQNQPQPTGDPVEEVNSQGLNCTVQEYAWAPGYDEPILLDPTTDIIFPGNIINSETIATGAYTPIIGSRTPITISTSLSGINGTPSITVEDPKLSTVRTAVNELLNQELTSGDIPARLTYEEQEIYSSKHLELALGGNFKNAFANVEASFNFNTDTEKSRYMIKFTQIFYSLDIDPKENPSDWFETPPNSSNLGAYSPVYISSVKYGRMGIMTFESNLSQTELSAAVKAQFNGLVASGGFEISTEWRQLEQDISFKTIVIGGSSQQASEVINGIDAFKEWVSKGGSYNATTVGAPLAYNMRFLKDNSIAKVVKAGNYKVRQCEVLPDEQDIILTHDDVAQTLSAQGVRLDVICPRLTGDGDREFDGNGPNQTAEVRLRFNDAKTQLSLEIYFHVKETRANWTEGIVRIIKPIYTAPDGYFISELMTDSYIRVEEEDNSLNLKTIPLASTELVRQLEIMGDTRGDDLPGNNENVTPEQCKDKYAYLGIELNPIEFTIQQR